MTADPATRGGRAIPDVDPIPRDRFLPLPSPDRTDGRPRRTGVEIEFAGLTEAQAAGIVRDLWGGRIEADGPHLVHVRGGALGEVAVTLDTGLKRHAGKPLADKALALARTVAPVEIVTAPLCPDRLPQTDRLVAALRRAGASGSRDGLLYGFGVHLNPEVIAETAAAILPTVRAYGLVEDWLRAVDPIDPARRLLPFVDPWPRRLVDLLAAEAADWSLADLTRAYLEITPSRNRGLDLLPLLAHLDPDAVAAALPGGDKTSGRPTWHYRLPDSRVDEADWSIAYEWNRWRVVEQVAADPALLDRLARDWIAYRADPAAVRGDWSAAVGALLGAAA